MQPEEALRNPAMPKFQRCVFAALSLAVMSACATKNFVRTSTGEVEKKVESLSQSLEQTQNRVQQNEAAIREANQGAEAAQQTAQQAREAASAAATIAKRVDAEVEALEKANRKLVYEVVMSEQEGGFAFGSAELPDAAKKQIDDLVAKLKEDPNDVFITIEGYTDSIGPREVNERLGLERAEAVARYLYEAHQIPLHRIEVISYGEQNPVAPNRTRAGRAQNRRIEIKVLA
jgi:outer membrane protein OmpA-like peptidoglycan-associated protein